MKRNIFTALISVFVLFLLASLFSLIFDRSNLTGPMLTLAFVSLAIGFHSNEKLKKLAFTIWIFAAVTVSMTYPGPFQEIQRFLVVCAGPDGRVQGWNRLDIMPEYERQGISKDFDGPALAAAEVWGEYLKLHIGAFTFDTPKIKTALDETAQFIAQLLGENR